MGCDIHCIAEIKIDGKWHLIDQIEIERDYDLFGYIAGLRRPVENHLPVRGLPKNLSKMGRLIYEFRENDYHTASWIDAAEIEAVIHKFKDCFGKFRPYLFGDGYTCFQEDPEHAPNIEDVRWVFWFDN